MPGVVQTTRTHDGNLFKVDVMSWTDERGRAVTREVVRHPGAVTVIPVLAADRVVMIRNHRIAVGERLWELPAGKLEPDETPEAAALRELAEETGYLGGRVTRLGEFYTSPGFADELMRVYLAEDLTCSVPALEPGEAITVEILELAEVMNMIRKGVIRDGKTIAGLLMYWVFTRNENQ